MLLMYLASFKDYSRKDMCNSLLLIMEVRTRLGPVVFPFTLGVFHIKILVFDLFFMLHEFIYLFLLVDIVYLVLHKEMAENFSCLLEYCEFTLTSGIKARLIISEISCVN